MGELVNLLLGAISPGTPASADPQAASPSKQAEVAGGGFQELMLKSLEGNPIREEAGESWAGQQVTEETKPGETKSEDESEKSTAGTEILLGSADTTPSLPEAVLVASALVIPPPQYGGDQPRAEAEIELTAQSAPESEPTVRIGFSPRSETGIAIPASPAAKTTAETPAASETPAAEAEVPAAAESALSVRSAQAQTEAAELVIPVRSAQAQTEAAESAVSVRSAQPQTEAAELVIPDRPAPVEQKLQSEAPPQKESPPIVKTVERLAAELPVAGASKPSLPDVPAPVSEKGAGQYQLQTPRLVLDVDGNASAKPEMRFADGSAPSAHPQSDPANPTNPSQPLERANTGRPVYVAQEIKDLLPSPVEAVPVERATSERIGETHSRTESDTPWALGDIRASDLRSVSNAERSQGYNAPERVVEQKLIHEIVRAAKVQLTEGGASMTMRLDPPHLGLLHMSVSAQQGTVTANLQTSTEAARNALQADLSLLKQALSDAGITVDSINVSLGAGADYEQMLHSGSHGDPANPGTHGAPRFVEGLLSSESEPAISDAHLQQIGGFDYLA